MVNYHQVKNWQQLPELENLKHLSTPPKELYFCGTWNPEIFKDCVAVVGSRKITDYGQRVIDKVIPQIVSRHQTVVSGLMYGVDQYAHQSCVSSGGKTIAVLGWGIGFTLSGNDLKLARQIIDSGGLLLSEWESVKPAHWTFPARNRIVAALSREVIVIEAAEKSGSLITARLALNLGQKLWAVPGPITSRTSRGTNKLIASGQAQAWLGESIADPTDSNDPVINLLDNEALSVDEIARKLNHSVSETGAHLSLLLLSGQVVEKGGKYYIVDAN